MICTLRKKKNRAPQKNYYYFFFYCHESIKENYYTKTLIHPDDKIMNQIVNTNYHPRTKCIIILKNESKQTPGGAGGFII